MLKRFENIKYLTLTSDVFDDWILNCIHPTCNTLMIKDESLQCVYPKFVESQCNSIILLLSDKALARGALKYVSEMAVRLNRQLVVYLFVTERIADVSNVLRHEKIIIDVSEILSDHDIQRLHVIGTARAGTEVTAAVNLVSCSFLTYLSVIGHVRLSQDMLQVINGAVTEGKLPCLENLALPGMNIQGQLKDLFEKPTVLPNMTDFLLSYCDLDKKDTKALCLASTNGLLPNLSSLHLADNHRFFRSAVKNIFTQNWRNLSSLSVKPLTKLGFMELVKGIGQKKLTNLKKLCVLMMLNATCNVGKIKSSKLPFLEHLSVQRCIASKKDLKHVTELLDHWSLHTLDISHSRGITGELSVLTRQTLTPLRSLILHDCDLNEKDMCSLAHLSYLENLDISENPHMIANLSAFSSNWESLKRLSIDYQPLVLCKRQNLFEILRPLGMPTAVITDLRITCAGSFLKKIGCSRHLERLDIVAPIYERSFILRDLIDVVEIGDLPALRTVGVLSANTSPIIDTDTLEKFSQKGVDVCVVDPDLEKTMIDVDLI